jgi:flagellar basal body-associated protein FliL
MPVRREKIRGGITMEKKASTFLLLIIIAVQTLIVAALAVFVFIVGVSPPNMSASADSPAPPAAGAESANVVIALPPPDEAELATIELFGENKFFNLKSNGEAKTSVIVVNVSIKYFNKIDGIKSVDEKINKNKPNLQEIVGIYFQNKTLDEIKEAETRIQAKEDLKKEMNDYLLATIDKEKDRRKVTSIIYDVAFSGWTYQ